jgi:catechol 2,3-dioxygenase-like lactoylglutathione lyase family enzyme
MELRYIDHINVTVPPDEVKALRDFYVQVLGLTEGPRPPFTFPGYWLYSGGNAVLHLVGRTGSGPGPLSTGKFNHVSFRTSGLPAAREKLKAHGIKWGESGVPGYDLYQIFFLDPAGVKIELTFEGEEARAAKADEIPAERARVDA